MAQSGERYDIEDAIRTIADRIVRGQRAEKSKEVKLYRWNKYGTVIVTAIIAALAAAGISNPLALLSRDDQKPQTLESALKSFNGWPLVLLISGLILFILLFVAREIIKAKDLEKNANMALSLKDAFNILEGHFDGVLARTNEPLEQLGPLREAAIAISTYWANVMPSSADCQADIDNYVQRKIEQYCHGWPSNVSVGRRIRP